MAIALLILVGVFVIVRPRLALSCFVFLVKEVIKAFIIMLFLGTLAALGVMLWRATGHVTQYEAMPSWECGIAVSMYGFPLMTILLIAVDLIRLSKKLKTTHGAQPETPDKSGV